MVFSLPLHFIATMPAFHLQRTNPNQDTNTIYIMYVYTSIGGGSMKSKERRSFIPIAFSERTTKAKFVLCISGTAVGSISSLYALSV